MLTLIGNKYIIDTNIFIEKIIHYEDFLNKHIILEDLVFNLVPFYFDSSRFNLHSQLIHSM